MYTKDMRRALHGALASICGTALLLAPQAVRAVPSVDRAAPPLVLATLAGSTFDLAQHREHVVLVNFWASWCAPCRDEMPLLQRYLDRHGGEGLELIGVSIDRRGDRRDVEQAMKPFSYPAALADGAKSNGFGAPRALPMTYVVDRAGVLRAVLVPGQGGLTEAALDAAILPLLGSAFTQTH